MIRVSSTLKTFVRPSEHSLFSPSGSDRWINCPYSINASKGIPEEPPSIYAAQGTLAHQICEDYANHYFFEAEKTQDLMEATDENMRSAQGWVEVISSWLSRPEEIGDIIYFDLEVGVPVFPERGCFGTSDAIIVGTKGCVSLDFKNGVGHSVGARSPQLQIYLLGLFKNILGTPEELKDYGFHAVVYQPRLDEVPKQVSYTWEEMKVFHDLIDKKINETKRMDLQPNLGSWCHWCPAKRTRDPKRMCPAQKQKTIDLAAESFEQYFADMNAPIEKFDEVNVKRDRAMIKLMSLKPLIDQVVKDAEEEFKDRILGGEDLEGVELKDKLGNRKWALSDDELKHRLKNLYGIESHIEQKPKLKTITQVEKEVGKKKFDDSLTMRPISKKVSLSDTSVKQILGELADYAAQWIEN